MQLSDVDTRRVNPTVKEGIGNQFSFLVGLALLGLVGLAFAALASWSVTDPSLSNANGSTISNTIGYPGAVFADFTMQFFGLASAIALIPPALWGWSKLLQRKIPALKNRLMLWPLAVLMTSAGFACFTTPQSWPLPVGLGGVGGDMVLNLPALLLGEISGFYAFIFGAIFLIIALWTLLAASALIWRLDEVAELQAEDIANDDDFLDEDIEPNWLLGAMSHYFYVFKMRYFKPKNQPLEAAPKVSLLQRAKALKEKLVTPSDDGLDDFDQYAQPQALTDPEIAAAQPVAPTEPAFESPQYGENTYNEYA